MRRLTSRRGDLRFVVEMLISIACVVFVLTLIYELIAGMTERSQDFSAKQNLDLVTKRIDDVKDNSLKPIDSTLIIALPKNYALVGFDATMEKMVFAPGKWYQFLADDLSDSRDVMRPKQCTPTIGEQTACLCVARLDYSDPGLFKKLAVTMRFVSCKRIPALRVATTVQKTELEVSTWDSFVNANINNAAKQPNPWPMPTYNFFITGHENPSSFVIVLKRDDLLLAAGDAGKQITASALTS